MKFALFICLLTASAFQSSDTAMALFQAKDLLEESMQKEDAEGIILALNQQLDIYIIRSDFEKAMEIAESIIKIAEDAGMTAEMANALYRVGSIYNSLGVYDKGSEYYFESLVLFEQVNEHEGIIRSLNGIGVIFYHKADYDKALEYFYRSLDMAKEINDHNGISMGLNNVAIVYQDRNDYVSARKYFMEALSINQQLGIEKSITINYLNLGLTNQELKNYDLALDYFQKAYDVLVNIDHNRLFATCLLYLGKFYLETGNLALSLEYAGSAYEKSMEIKSRKVIYQSLELFHKIFIQKNDTGNAYRYSVLMLQAKDSLDIEANTTELAMLELAYEFEKKENRQIVIQQRKDFIKLIIIIILVFSLIVALLLFARYRIKARAEQLKKEKLKRELEIKQREIEYKNKELTTTIMHQMVKNELITSLSNKIIEMENSADKEETRHALNRVAAELSKSVEHELWEDFEMRFKNVHSNFYDELIRRYPDLSPNEMRLCAFLRLNMSTKEISELTGQQTRTIETARTRLRKKMGISNSDISLVSHLTQIQ